jgi:amino acid transporter
VTKRKIIRTIALYVGLCALTVILYWGGWRTPVSLHDLLKIVIGLSVLATIWVIFFGLICGIIVRRIQRRHPQWLTAVLCVIVAVTILIYTVIPLTTPYLYANYLLNEQSRDNIINMLENDRLGQIGRNKFILPAWLSLSSVTGEIYTQLEYDTLLFRDYEGHYKVMFYVHYGTWKHAAVIYISDDSEVEDGDFGSTFTRVRKLKDHWYGVLME